jgi:hypothetical protein
MLMHDSNVGRLGCMLHSIKGRSELGACGREMQV